MYQALSMLRFPEVIRSKGELCDKALLHPKEEHTTHDFLDSEQINSQFCGISQILRRSFFAYTKEPSCP